MSAVVEVSELHKKYGDLHALKGISFSIQQGEIFALLGPNGAGKSTCVEILEGYRKATSGTVEVLGQNPADHNLDAKNRIGAVLQISGIEKELTPKEALEIYSSSYKNARPAMELLELVSLKEKANQRIGKLSGGQKRRLDLALGLAGNPDLLFLDEPTTGFAPEARREAWDMLYRMKESGMTILLTSHYLEEVNFLADRMAVLVAGEVAFMGDLQDLSYRATRVQFVLPQNIHSDELKAMDIENLEIIGTKAVLFTENPTKLLYELTSLARQAGQSLEGLQVESSDLESSYLRLIQEAALQEHIQEEQKSEEPSENEVG